MTNGPIPMPVSSESVAEKLARIRLHGKLRIAAAQRFTKNSAYWYGHPSGSPAHAPGHFERVQSGPNGWEIEFGANKFLVERAYDRCENLLREAVTTAGGARIDRSELCNKMRLAVRGAVANYLNEEYTVLWDVTDDGYMLFGTQSIRVDAFINTLLDYVGI
jgi:hypothetical protein